MSRIHDKLFKIHKWIYLQKCSNIVHQCFIHTVRLPNFNGLAEQNLYRKMVCRSLKREVKICWRGVSLSSVKNQLWFFTERFCKWSPREETNNVRQVINIARTVSKIRNYCNVLYSRCRCTEPYDSERDPQCANLFQTKHFDAKIFVVFTSLKCAISICGFDPERFDIQPGTMLKRKKTYFFVWFSAVLWIRDILVRTRIRIWIHWYIPLTYGSCSFPQWP
jgi:hypothetical protein